MLMVVGHVSHLLVLVGHVGVRAQDAAAAAAMAEANFEELLALRRRQ